MKLSPSLERILQKLTVGNGAVLFVVWPLVNTIALRNITLFLGCICGLIIFINTKPKPSIKACLPIILLLAVPLWLWMHYFFFPVEPSIALRELTGTWVRVILAILLGFFIGLIVKKDPKLVYWIWGAMIFLSLVTFVMYFIEAIRIHDWYFDDFKGPFKYKSAVTYFVMFPCLIAFALFNFYSHSPEKKKNTKIIYISMALAGLCFIDFVVAKSLLGILFFSGLILLSVVLDLKKLSSFYCAKAEKKKLFIRFILALLIIASIVLVFDRKDQNQTRTLPNVISDINQAHEFHVRLVDQANNGGIGILRIDKLQANPASWSTLTRALWFFEGFEILKQNPWGAGFTQLPFQYYVTRNNPHIKIGLTHSGWLDFALGVGLPGILLVWLSLAVSLERAKDLVKSSSQFSSINGYIAIFLICGLWLLCLALEISEKEFIENFFFVFSFFGFISSQELLQE